VKRAGRADRVLEVGDLLLRPWRAGDESEVLRAFADPAIRQYAGNLVDTAADADRFVRVRAASWDDGSGASWHR
jgi:hypothetical protein